MYSTTPAAEPLAVRRQMSVVVQSLQFVEFAALDRRRLPDLCRPSSMWMYLLCPGRWFPMLCQHRYLSY